MTANPCLYKEAHQLQHGFLCACSAPQGEELSGFVHNLEVREMRTAS